MVPTLQITQLATWHATWAMIFTDWDFSQHYLTELNRTCTSSTPSLALAPWVESNIASDEKLLKDNMLFKPSHHLCNKFLHRLCNGRIASTTRNGTIRWCVHILVQFKSLSPSDWVCLILRVCHSGLLWILESQKREIDPQSSSFSTILVSKCAVVPSRRTLPFRGNSQMISEHMIPRPKAKIARERAKCLFDGRHLCFADDTILASVFWLLFLGSSFWVDWLASNGRLERLQIYNLFVGFLPIHLPLFQSLLASRALKTWHHSGVDESKKEACCQCYLPTCYGLHNPPLPHAPDIKLSTMTPWITTTLAPIFTRYNWYNLLLSLFHEFPLLKPHQEAGRLASLPPTPPVHCTMWRCA